MKKKKKNKRKKLTTQLVSSFARTPATSSNQIPNALPIELRITAYHKT